MTDAPAHTHPLLVSPPLPTLLRLAAPNALAMGASTVVSIAETAYIGALGAAPLAAAALVFPMIMLMNMMSGGAMGGGVSSAISRALGAGAHARAEDLARHAAYLGFGLGIAFLILMLAFGRPLYALLGGRGEALTAAIGYSGIVFFAAVNIWLAAMFSSILRAQGDMLSPSMTLLSTAVVQIALGGALCFGLGPFPQLGIVGVGLGQVISTGVSALVMFALLRRKRATVKLRLSGQLRADLFADILRVGLPACLSPIQSVLTVLVVTAVAARFGTETLAGYGIGARLEFLLIPIAFAFGVASLPMVGLAVGAGDIPRARRVAWTAGALAGAIVGALGILVAIFPDLWARIFTDNQAIRDATAGYLRIVGPCFSVFGVGLALYFSSQGAGRVLGPILAGTARLVVVALGGWYLISTDAPAWGLFVVVALGMLAYGGGTALSVLLTPWRKAG